MPSVMHQPWAAATTACPRSAVVAPRIAGIVGPIQRPVHKARAHFGEIEPSGEIVAVRIQHAGAQLVVAFESFVRSAELLQHLDVERVSLCRPVEPHVKDVIVLFDYDSWHSAEGRL